MPAKYHRVLPVTSLKDVENPWKGFSLNRCILVAVVVMVVSSGFEAMQNTVQPFFEVAENGKDLDVQGENAEAEESWWDSLAFWNWGVEDENDASFETGARAKTTRKKDIPGKRLLKERD